MVTRSSEAAERIEGRDIGPAVRAVGGLLLALAVVVAIGARHLAEQRDAGAVSMQPQGVESPAYLTAAPVPVLKVYVVDSQAAAELMREGVAIANAVRSEPPLRDVVVVVRPEDTGGVLQALQDDARIPPDGGLLVQVVDLRRSS
jgi:hypothetical protein